MKFKDKHILAENLAPNFDFDQCIPTVVDFEKIVTWYCDYLADTDNEDKAVGIPGLMTHIVALDRYKLLRFYFISTLLEIPEYEAALGARTLREFSQEDLRTIAEYVSTHAYRFNRLLAIYKPKLTADKNKIMMGKSLQESSSGLTADEKIDFWHNKLNNLSTPDKQRGLNYPACKDDKLKHYYDICVSKGYTQEADILRAEAAKRGLSWGNIQQSPKINLSENDFQIADMNYILQHRSDPETIIDNIGSDYAFGIVILILALTLNDSALANAIFDHLRQYASEATIKRDAAAPLSNTSVLARITDIQNMAARAMNGAVSESLEEPQLEEDVEKHDTLNPKLWTEDEELKPEVKEKIDLMVNEFLKTLEKDDVKINVKDVVIIGSNCSYNYTENSDLDVHIVAETKSLKDPAELYPTLYTAYRKLFEKKFDIEFYGIPVELYVETEGLPTVSNGCYSVKDMKWIKRPELKDIPDFDQEAFDKEFAKWEEKYNDLLASLETPGISLTEELKNKDLDKIKAFTDELYALRKDGLSKEGEYGTENLIFKEFRSRGYLDNLKSLKNAIIGKELSLDDQDIEQADEKPDEEPEDEVIEESLNGLTIDEYRIKLSRLLGKQPLIQRNGRFDIYNVREADVDRILRQLRQLPEVKYAEKTSGKFDFSSIILSAGQAVPRRKYNVYGQLNIGEDDEN